MQTNYSTKANKILYVSVIAVLCVIAVTIGIIASVSAGRSKDAPVDEPAITDPIETPSDTPVEVPVEDDTNKIPVFIAPTSGIVSWEHSEDIYVFSPSMNDYRTHTGIDIATSLGADVYAAADGVVTKVWNDDFMGKCISISHNGDTVTVYKNLANEVAKGIVEGASVSAGQKIATVGDTAASESADEPHLHFELLVKNASVDPLDYIAEDSKSASLSKDEAFEG